MDDLPKKNEPVLLPENENFRPVKNPWVWIVLLLFAVLSVFWKIGMHDETATQKQMLENKKVIDAQKLREKNARKALYKNNKFDPKNPKNYIKPKNKRDYK